jgi:hypothetical protein
MDAAWVRLGVEAAAALLYTPSQQNNLRTIPGMRKALPLLSLVSVLALAGCASNGMSVGNAPQMQAEQLAPVQGGNVSTSALPPIGPNGEVQGSTPSPLVPNDGFGGDMVADRGNAGSNDSFSTLPAVGALPNAAGRDLTGGLTTEKLLGRWTVVSGAEQCQLNLTQTQKTGTSRYRASAPACGLAGMAQVASWSIAGTQVQLFDEGGKLIAALILSGNRFIGTMSGGTGISMVG